MNIPAHVKLVASEDIFFPHVVLQLHCTPPCTCPALCIYSKSQMMFISDPVLSSLCACYGALSFVIVMTQYFVGKHMLGSLYFFSQKKVFYFVAPLRGGVFTA